VDAASDVAVTWSPQAFEDFYRQEYRAVVALAYALSGNRWTAEDLAQDAFVAVHRDWARVAHLEHPASWVRRVVSNMAVSAFRRRVAEARALARLSRGSPRVAELPAEAEEFWRVVRGLPRRQAQVVALFYLEDMAVADIAGVLGMATGTVKKHLYDGRQALAQRLRDDEGER
jgi:RNA polymerase sigma-70 factor (ECF subfamily)